MARPHCDDFGDFYWRCLRFYNLDLRDALRIWFNERGFPEDYKVIEWVARSGASRHSARIFRNRSKRNVRALARELRRELFLLDCG